MTDQVASGSPRAAVPAIAVGLAATLAIGLWLRWRLTGLLPLSALDRIPFAYARHAHSHLGYYAVLIPLGWLAWRARGRPSLSRVEALTYAAATALATLGFFRRGYGLLAIIGSTVIGVLWLVAGARVARCAQGARDPLHLVLPGTVAALACIPVIAISLRRDPAVAAAAVQSFLAALLFLVVAPSAIVARGQRLPSLLGGERAALPLALVAGVLAALALGLWPSLLSRAGLALLAAQWAKSALDLRADAPLAAAWLAAALGMVALAVGLVPNVHHVGIGAVHFIVLGPLLPSLVQDHLRPRPSATSWWLHLGAVSLLSGPLAWRGIAGGAWIATAAAIGGSSVVLWWAAQGLRAWRVAATARSAA